VAWFSVVSEDSGGQRELPGLAVQRLRPRSCRSIFANRTGVELLIIDRATYRCDFADRIRWNHA
jgi:L-arabinose isomerase